MKKLLTLITLLFAMPAANATLMLSIGEDTDSVLVVDTNNDGLVNYAGSFGGFEYILSIGASDPYQGSPTDPRMSLRSISLTNPLGVGTITVRLTDTDFVGPVGDAFDSLTTLTGLSGGWLGLDTYLGTSNGAFATDVQLASFQGLNGLYLFEESRNLVEGLSIGPDSPYSLTMVATITHSHFDLLTTFGASLTTVPEPATIALFGLGLLMVLWGSRRRLQATA